MTKSFSFICAVFSIGTLAACGGSGDGGSNTANPASFTRGPDRPAFDTETGVLSFVGQEIGRTGDEVLAQNGDARVTRDAAFTSRVAQIRTDSGYALAYATYSGDRLSGAIYGRDDTPTLPTGSATLIGDYGGVTTRSTGLAGQQISSLTTGNANLTVDFNGDTVSGRITNRSVSEANGGPFAATSAADIVLRPSTLTDDGLFSGTMTGGQFLQLTNTYTTSGGSYSGALAGDDADEAVGALSFTHRQNNGTLFVERGAFGVTR